MSERPWEVQSWRQKNEHPIHGNKNSNKSSNNNNGNHKNGDRTRQTEFGAEAEAELLVVEAASDYLR